MFLDEWKNITSCETILNWITYGVSIPFVRTPTEPVHIQNYKHLSPKEKNFIEEEVTNLCAQKCVVKCEEAPHFISPLNVVPKADGSYRLILDLRELNKIKWCWPKSFIYEDISTVVNLLQPNDKLVTIDLKSAFFHIPISSEHSTFLGFEWQGCFYKFVVLPFGACFSPYFCYKLVRPKSNFFERDIIYA